MAAGRAGLMVLGLTLLCGAPHAARAQETPELLTSISESRLFAPGERLTYSVRVGAFGRGRAVAEIIGADTLRGRTVYHTIFKLDGSLLFFKVNDLYESWFDPTTLVSLRYHQNIDQGPYERDRRFEIFPERGTYVDANDVELPTVMRPLDDGAFLYFLRTIPLEVGQTYTFNRYFKPDRNPVTIVVVRRERIRVPAGEFDAVVLQPKIKAKGIFAEGANAEVWIEDGGSRMMLQMKTRLPFGGVTFQLSRREIVPVIAAASPR
ncbi:MAG: DUF3108 domain-containing protein [Gemmatimonadaceae bacterium]